MTKNTVLAILVMGITSLVTTAAKASEAGNIRLPTFVDARPFRVGTSVRNVSRFVVHCHVEARGQIAADGFVATNFVNVDLWPGQVGWTEVNPAYSYFLPVGPYTGTGGFSDCWF